MKLKRYCKIFIHTIFEYQWYLFKTTSIYIIKTKILFTNGLLKECRGKGYYTVFSGFLSCFNSDVSPNQRDTSFDFSFNNVVLGSLPKQHFPYSKGGEKYNVSI